MNSRENPNGFRSVLVTGGAGYVGSALVPQLLHGGYNVKVVDLFWFGDDVFGEFSKHPRLQLVRLDIRDTEQLKRELQGTDVVIHLACISNDPSFELDPNLSKSINYHAFVGLLNGAIELGVRRFIYASSSSIYGVKEEKDVREDSPPFPLTDYSKYKLACERLLLDANPRGMERVIARPATVCGYARRLRLDLTLNILTIHALVNRKIRVFGGKQLRPNLQIADMVRAYETLLAAPAEKIDGQAFNIGYQNRSVEELALLVRETIEDPGIAIEHVPTDDGRSYHINSDKISAVLGFKPEHTIEDAVRSLAEKYRAGSIPDPMTDLRYYNIRTMQALKLR